MYDVTPIGVASAHLVADFGADRASACTVHEATGVAVVPMLVAELLLSHCESAELVVQSLSFLCMPRRGREEKCKGMNECVIIQTKASSSPLYLLLPQSLDFTRRFFSLRIVFIFGG